MTFLTLFVLLVINFCWFYIYLAVQFTQYQLNGWLWNWLQINFEPSNYISVALTVALTAQLLLVAIVYMYSAYGRHIRGKFTRLQLSNKNLQLQRKANQKVLEEQAANLANAGSLEEKNTILTEQVTYLSDQVRTLESQLHSVQKEADALESLVHKDQILSEDSTNYFQNLQKKALAIFKK